MFDQFTKIASITAAEIVEHQRRFAATVIGLIPHEETKKSLENASKVQLSFAEACADQVDKNVRKFKETFKFAM